MTRDEICAYASNAAMVAGQMLRTADLRPLYDWMVLEQFPPALDIAVKWGGLSDNPFPFESMDAAPERVQVFFTVFRTVALAIEPFAEAQSASIASDEKAW